MAHIRLNGSEEEKRFSQAQFPELFSEYLDKAMEQWAGYDQSDPDYWSLSSFLDARCEDCRDYLYMFDKDRLKKIEQTKFDTYDKKNQELMMQVFYSVLSGMIRGKTNYMKEIDREIASIPCLEGVIFFPQYKSIEQELEATMESHYRSEMGECYDIKDPVKFEECMEKKEMERDQIGPAPFRHIIYHWYRYYWM